ncbi:MAG: 4Fe-4S domain-containing protein [Planctomycetota bacterium]|jgi:cytochrome b6-f complex iron-sulfur subunit
MAVKEVVTKVWIEEGCIVCDACETTAPDVFDVTDDTCLIRPEALAPDFTKPRTEDIKDAAEECPVDVIKFDIVEEDVGDEAPAAAPAEPAAAEAPAAAAPAPVAAATPAPAAAAPAKAEAKPAVEKAVSASVAGAPDPAIAALLKAATARGGNVAIMAGASGSPAADQFSGMKPSELPPDARQAKVLEAAKKISEEPDMARRGVAGGAALAVGWAAFGLGLGTSIGPAFGRFLMPNVLEEPDPRVRVGPLKKYVEMSPGDVNEDFKPQGIWMIREQDRIAALNIICTHLGCIPNWLPNDRKFKCPCHGSGYRPDGVNFEGPTPRPLERFKLVVDGGQVIVDKSKKYQYELGQWDMLGSFLEV